MKRQGAGTIIASNVICSWCVSVLSGLSICCMNRMVSPMVNKNVVVMILMGFLLSSGM